MIVRARAVSRFRLAATAAIAALLVTLVPGVGDAHFEQAGPSGAQIDVTPDGSEPVADGVGPGLAPSQTVTVSGKTFKASALVQLLQCRSRFSEFAGVPFDCIVVGSIQSDATGGFVTTVPVSVELNTTNPQNTNTMCASQGTDQCLIVAQYVQSSLPRPVEATHNICFASVSGANGACTTDRTATSTTTTAPTTTTTTSPTTTTTTAPTTTTSTTPGPTTTTMPPKPPSRDRLIVWRDEYLLNEYPDPIPVERTTAAMAYDGPRNEVVLFGGRGYPNPVESVYNDTWTWNGVDWAEKRPASSPSARTGHAMAYDAARQQVVLFGGNDKYGAPLGDTWTWDGVTWTQRQVAGPSARAFTAMTYDAARERVVLFGGDREGVALGDTWTWDGAGWTAQSPQSSPPARGHAALADHPPTAKALLFGGWGAGTTPLGDTWSWNGSNWSQENTGPYPEARQSHGMAYDAVTRQIVLTGGNASRPGTAGGLNDTWTWDGDDWGTGPVADREAIVSGTDYRASPTMSDGPGGHVLLFGGTSSSDRPMTATKTFAAPTATLPGLPPPSGDVCAAREPGTSPATSPPGGGATTTTTAPPPTTTTTTTPGTQVTVAGANAVWKEEMPTTSPSPREGAAMASDGTQVVLFGGFSRAGGPCVLGDTWTWDGSNWTEQHPATSPPARYGATMARSGGGAVLFGGYDGTSDLGDTWVWDAAARTWSPGQTGTAPSPSARARSVMAYDADRSRVVLFGGDHAGSVLGDTWTWDGTAWAEQHLATTPPARGFAAMAYHVPTKRVVLVGGWNGSAVVGGTWLWDGSTWVDANASAYPILSSPMAYDPTSQRLVVIPSGSEAPGRPPCGACGFTVAWNGRAWATSEASSAKPTSRTFAAMAEDPLGHAVIFGGYGTDRIGGATYDPAFRQDADRGDTWTLQAYTDPATIPSPVGPSDVQEQMKVTVGPGEIAPDAASTATATATVTRAGVPLSGYHVTFSTDGDVTFSPATGDTDSNGRLTTTVTASKTPGVETLTAEAKRPAQPPGAYGSALGPIRGSAPLVERGVAVLLEPASLHPDGISTSRATATVFKAGPLAADEAVDFTTSGDVTFSAVDKTGDNTWATTIKASLTASQETITATARRAGLTGSAALDEGGNGWFEQSRPGAPAPPAREQAAMAFDAARNQTVLFGGVDGTGRPFGDTWTWDGNKWTEQHPATSPLGRLGHAMAYDAARGQVVLFGGYRNGYLADGTWTWDGTNWVSHGGGAPPSRIRPAMTYDGARAEVVLFGGWNGTDCNPDTRRCRAFDDTWTWDGAGWTERVASPPPSPPPASSVIVESNTSAIVVPQDAPPPGCPGSHCPADAADLYPSPITVSGVPEKVAKVTVTLNDLTWTRDGPGDADIMLVGPDGQTSAMLMSDVCGDSSAPNPIPPGPTAIDLTFDDGAAQALPARDPCAGGTYRPTNVTTAEATGFHSPDAFPAPAPNRADGDSLGIFTGMDPNGTWSLYVVDDTPQGFAPQPETGRIDGGWTLSITTTEAIARPAPPVKPPARGWAAMAYDPGSGKVVMYGGSEVWLRCDSSVTSQPAVCGPFRPRADTWTWDGTTWEQKGAGTTPGPRQSPAMSRDPGSGQLLLFGGSSDTGGNVPDERYRSQPERGDALGDSLGDTWAWNGDGWAPQQVSTSPPSRHSAAMAQGPSGQVVMFGGLHFVSGAYGTLEPNVSTYLGDTWTYESEASLRLSPAVLPADGASRSTAVATVRSSDGSPIRGLSVTFSTNGDATFSAVTDRGDGTYSATVTAGLNDGVEVVTVHTARGAATASLDEVRPAPCSVAGVPASAAGEWNTRAPAPTARSRVAAAGGADGRVHVFGGEIAGQLQDPYVATVESYDPCTDTWRSLPPMPGGARRGATAASGPDGRIYVTGGDLYGADVAEVYLPGTGTSAGHWETLPPMPTKRAYGVSAVGTDGRLYVGAGGADSGAVCASNRSVDVYAPAVGGAGTWQRTGDMFAGRFGGAAATGPDGRIFAMGGQGEQCAFENTAEAYRPSSASWERVAPMTYGRALFAAATGGDGLVYALGGAGDTLYGGGVNSVSTVEAYSSCAASWVPVAPMPRGRARHGAATGPDGRIYAVGGLVADAGGATQGQTGAQPTAALDVYTPDPESHTCPKVSVSDVTVTEPLWVPRPPGSRSASTARQSSRCGSATRPSTARPPRGATTPPCRARSSSPPGRPRRRCR